MENFKPEKNYKMPDKRRIRKTLCTENYIKEGKAYL